MEKKTRKKIKKDKKCFNNKPKGSKKSNKLKKEVTFFVIIVHVL